MSRCSCKKKRGHAAARTSTNKPKPLKTPKSAAKPSIPLLTTLKPATNSFSKYLSLYRDPPSDSLPVPLSRIYPATIYLSHDHTPVLGDRLPSPAMQFPVFLCFLGACFVSGRALGDDAGWPKFRGPSGDGHSGAVDVPLRWSASEGVTWKVAVPGRGWSSPVHRGGRIYVTTAVITDGGEESNPQADRSLRAMCLDLATGRTLWDVEVFKQRGATAPDTIHQKNGHASPTPIIADDGRLYVHFGHQGTAALNLSDGKKVWENRSLTYPPRHGNGGSPVLVDGRLIFSADAESDPFIAALDPANGTIVWKRERPETAQRQKFGFSTAGVFTVDGQIQVVSAGPGAVDSFAPADGRHFWRVAYEGYSNVPNPVMAHGLIFVTTSYDTPDMYAIDPSGAKGDATDTHVRWTSDVKAPMTVSPIVIGEEIYWISDQGGFVTCADAKTGTVHWSERIGARAVSASPVHASGRLYILDEEGKMHVLKPGKSLEKLAENDLDDRALASPAPLNGALLIRTESALWRVGN
jgi:outer membrane protein assembly factor BamB